MLIFGILAPLSFYPFVHLSFPFIPFCSSPVGCSFSVSRFFFKEVRCQVFMAFSRQVFNVCGHHLDSVKIVYHTLILLHLDSLELLLLLVYCSPCILVKFLIDCRQKFLAGLRIPDDGYQTVRDRLEQEVDYHFVGAVDRTAFILLVSLISFIPIMDYVHDLLNCVRYFFHHLLVVFFIYIHIQPLIVHTSALLDRCGQLLRLLHTRLSFSLEK